MFNLLGLFVSQNCSFGMQIEREVIQRWRGVNRDMLLILLLYYRMYVETPPCNATTAAAWTRRKRDANRVCVSIHGQLYSANSVDADDIGHWEFTKRGENACNQDFGACVTNRMSLALGLLCRTRISPLVRGRCRWSLMSQVFVYDIAGVPEVHLLNAVISTKCITLKSYK